MSPQENKEVIARLFAEVMNKRNFALIDELIAPDFVNRGIPNSRPGADGFKDVINQFLTGFPDMKITVEHIIGDGDLVATSGRWTGTHQGEFMGQPASGRKVEIP